MTNSKESVGGREGGGDSGGGAYPNPHTGKESGEKDGFLGRGGQSGMDYHGQGSLGDRKARTPTPAGGASSDPEEG